MGSRVENEIANALTSTPQLVKLGVTMEFRDSLNKSAIQLQKNLDRRMFYRLFAFDSVQFTILKLRQTTNHEKGLQRYRVSQKKSMIKIFSSDIITGEFIKAVGGGGATRYKWSKF